MVSKKIVIKIGGSLIYDDQLRLNVLFLAKLKKWIDVNIEYYDKIVMVVGGGKLSRYIQEKTEDQTQTDDDLHGIAMQVTVLNAQILKEIFDEKDSDIVVPKTLGELFEFAMDDHHKVIISGGLKKGWSTDMDAAICANSIGHRRVYKLSVIDGVYDKDPSLHPDAQFIKELSWQDYFEIFDIEAGYSTHKPNSRIPVDVQCAQYCKENGIDFFLSGGSGIEEVKDLGELFEEGTYIG